MVRDNAEDWHVSYVFLRQRGKHHSKLKADSQNGFTTGGDRHPNNRQQTLHLLDKYSKSDAPREWFSEGTMFAQQEKEAARERERCQS